MRTMTSMRWRISAAAIIVAALATLGGAASDAQQVGTVQISQTVEPQQFYVRDSGVPDEESAEIRLQFNTPELPDRLPTDLMLIVDRSASFPIDRASRAAKRLINALDANDRVGLVSFATEATVDAPLTPATDAGRVRDALDDLVAEGKTGLGAGIAVAADELDFSSRDNAERVAVLLTDGRSNFGRDPIEAAQTAADNDVTLYSIGIGDFPNRNMLTDVAETTGGQFFETFSDSIAQTIFERSISEDMSFARDVEVVATINSEFTFEGALRNPPASTVQHPDGATELQWRRSALEPDSTWELRFEVSADEDGTFALYNSTAYVRYTNLQGREVEQDLPNVSLRVQPAPPSVNASFRYDPNNPDRFDTISFTDRSSVESGGQIAQWEWDFDDGRTSTLQNPTHQYHDDGTYRVELTVTTTDGVEDTATETIQVSTEPQVVNADFDYRPDDPTRFDEIQFNDKSTLEPRGQIERWRWNFGDGTISTQQNPTHQYNSDGTYRVTLRVITDEGIEDRAEETVKIATPEQEIDAEFTFSPDDPTRFDEITFTDESEVEPRGHIADWEWEFGDGETSTSQHPSHQYDEDGTYRVTLTVTTDEDNEASITKTVTVETPPQVVEPDFAYTPSDPSRIDEIEFSDETDVTPRGEVTEWHWDFGDGTRSTKANPTHQYDEDGTYRVTLEVTTDEDNEATVTKTVEVTTPLVKATRTIDTFIPTDRTLPTRKFRVTVDLQVNVAIHGLGLDENVPDGWEVTPVQNSTAQIRSDDLQWLFSETFEPGAERTIVYEVTVPEFDNPGTFQIDGTISSASPELNVAVEGDTQLEVVSGFSIPVVIAHWDTTNKKLDLQAFPTHTINKNQILQAIAWWQEGTNVPNTQDAAGNKRAIDFAMIQKLVSYWLTDTSVFEELPDVDLDANEDEDDKDNGDDDDDSEDDSE